MERNWKSTRQTTAFQRTCREINLKFDLNTTLECSSQSVVSLLRSSLLMSPDYSYHSNHPVNSISEQQMLHGQPSSQNQNHSSCCLLDVIPHSLQNSAQPSHCIISHAQFSSIPCPNEWRMSPWETLLRSAITPRIAIMYVINQVTEQVHDASRHSGVRPMFDSIKIAKRVPSHVNNSLTTRLPTLEGKTDGLPIITTLSKLVNVCTHVIKFVIGIPFSNSYNSPLTITPKFTKEIILIPC